MNENEFDHIWDFMNEDGYQLEKLHLIKDCIGFLVCETGLDYEDFLIKVIEPTVEDDMNCPGNFEFKIRLVGTEDKRSDHCTYSARDLGFLVLGFESGYGKSGESDLNAVCWNKKKYVWAREGEHFFYKVTDILAVRPRNDV